MLIEWRYRSPLSYYWLGPWDRCSSSKHSFDFTALARRMDTINLRQLLQGYVHDHLDEHGAARVTWHKSSWRNLIYVISEIVAIVGAPGRMIPCLFGLSLSSRPTVTSSPSVANEKWSTKFVKRHNGGGHIHSWVSQPTPRRKRPNLQKSYKKWLVSNEGWEWILSLLSFWA